MNRRVLLAIAAVLTAGSMRAEEEPPAVLTGIKYNIFKEHSRVTLLFSAQPRYAVEEKMAGLAVSFSGTTVAPKPGAARLRFASGSVRALVVDRVGKDGLRISIGFASPGSYQISWNSRGTEWYLDVPMVRPPARPPLEKANGGKNPPRKRSGSVSPGELKVVDIGAMAKAQMEDARRVQDSIEAARTESHPRADDEEGGMSITRAILSVLGVLGLLFVLAIGALYVQFRRQLAETAARGRSKAVVADLPRIPRVATLYARVPEPTEPVIPEPAHADDLPEPDDAVTAARRLRRSTGDVQFAYQKQAGSCELRTRKLIEARAETLTPQQRTALARRLGLGLGEVELVAHLDALKIRQTEEATKP